MNNATLSNTRTRNADLLFWLKWVVISMTAILLSYGAIYGVILIAKVISPSINEDRLGGYILLPITATLLGVSQWFVLKRRIPKSGWWILATIVGIVGGIALVGVAVQAISNITGQEWNWDYLPALLTFYLLIGLLLGLAQLPILWRHFRGAVLWLLANMFGWLVLGLFVGVSIDRTSDIFAVGVVPAIFSGVGLVWLMRTPRTEPPPSP